MGHVPVRMEKVRSRLLSLHMLAYDRVLRDWFLRDQSRIISITSRGTEQVSISSNSFCRQRYWSKLVTFFLDYCQQCGLTRGVTRLVLLSIIP